MKEEGGCPFTKMFKSAGTPHVGAILIVLFIAAGVVYYRLMGGLVPSATQEHVVKRLLELSEKEEIENGLKKLSPARRGESGGIPRGYIKIMNKPGDGGKEGAYFVEGKEDGYPIFQQVEITGTTMDPEFHGVGPKYKELPFDAMEAPKESALVDLEYEKFVKKANKGVVDVSKLKKSTGTGTLAVPPDYVPSVSSPVAVPTLTDQVKR